MGSWSTRFALVKLDLTHSKLVIKFALLSTENDIWGKQYAGIWDLIKIQAGKRN